jgi:hypothetical protein
MKSHPVSRVGGVFAKGFVRLNLPTLGLSYPQLVSACRHFRPSTPSGQILRQLLTLQI